MKIKGFYFFTIIIYICSINSYGSSWVNTFYTDDSKYYLKVGKTHFTQRFRVKKENCSELVSAVLKTRTNQANFKTISANSTRWPSIYGIIEENYCWFEAKITDINLNRPEQNRYLIEIHSRDGEVSHFTGLTDSILPKNRITNRKTGITWISLGLQGATPVIGGGVLFKIWEPLAEEVHLFINGSNTPLRMYKDSSRRNMSLNHVLYLKNARPGDRYRFKFLKNGAYENLEIGNNLKFSEFKIDPYAREITYDKKGGSLNCYQNAHSVVEKQNSFKWEKKESLKNIEEWLTYQIWPLTFNTLGSKKSIKAGSFLSILDKLDYIEKLGVNSVEFMPLHEARLNASWGYMADSILLIEKTLGTPKDLKKVVQGLHNKNIRVIFDIVLNHINNSLIRDPITESMFKSKYYDGDTGWGPRPNFKNIFVKKWIMDSILSLVRDYHIDGLRFDMVKFVYTDNNHGHYFLQELNEVLKLTNPEIFLVAEELPDNIWTTFPQVDQGLGFDSQWNDLFKNFFEKDLNFYRDSNRSLHKGKLIRALGGFSNHLYHHFGSPFKTVNYIGSHDFVGNHNPIIRAVSGYESFETVGSTTFSTVKPLLVKKNLEKNFRIIHNDFTHSFGKLAYGILFTKPGNILFFQGEELASDLNIQNEWDYIIPVNNQPTIDIDLKRYLNSHKMLWEYLAPERHRSLNFLQQNEIKLFKGYTNFFLTLISFRKELKKIEGDAYNIRTSYGDSIVTYQIKTKKDDFFVIANFENTLGGAWVQFPSDSDDYWEEIINSSNRIFGSSSDRHLNIISSLGGRNNLIRSFGPSISIFKKTKVPNITKILYLKGSINNWKANKSYILKKTDHAPNIYQVEFKTAKNSVEEFKLSTKSWEIELGVASTTDYLVQKIFNTSQFGYLSYLPGRPNLKISLKKGRYLFTFNIKTFKYNFKLLDLL